MVISKINEQPKIGNWIPVEERLPELYREDMEAEGECYMISDPVIATDGDRMYVAEYEIDDDDRKEWHSSEGAVVEDIIAWMPLPEPYQNSHSQNDE